MTNGVGHFVTPPAALATVVDHLSETVRETAAGAASGRPGDGIRNHENQAGRQLSPQVTERLSVTAPDSSGQGSPAVSQAGESGWRAVAVAAVEALDGSERKLLLARLADSEPEVVVAALVWLEQWHAGNREQRRADRRRAEHDRRRRQRAGTSADTRLPQ
jgi:hypothetical protein